MILISFLAYPTIIYITAKFSFQSILFPGPLGHIVEITIISTIIYAIFIFFLVITAGALEDQEYKK